MIKYHNINKKVNNVQVWGLINAYSLCLKLFSNWFSIPIMLNRLRTYSNKISRKQMFEIDNHTILCTTYKKWRANSVNNVLPSDSLISQKWRVLGWYRFRDTSKNTNSEVWCTLRYWLNRNSNWYNMLKTRSDKIVYWLCRFSFLLGFITSKNPKRLWFYLQIKVQNATSLSFLT